MPAYLGPELVLCFSQPRADSGPLDLLYEPALLRADVRKTGSGMGEHATARRRLDHQHVVVQEGHAMQGEVERNRGFAHAAASDDCDRRVAVSDRARVEDPKH